MKVDFLDRFSKNVGSVKFHESALSGSRIVPRGRTEGTDVTKLTVAFRSSAKAPKNKNKKICC
jgi:hypothetical protein